MNKKQLYEAPEAEELFVKIEKRILDPSLVDRRGTVPEVDLYDYEDEY